MPSGVCTKEQKRFKSVYCASGFTHGVPYVLDYDSSAHGPVAATPAALAVYQYIGVPQGETTTVPGWYPFQIEGECEAMVYGDPDVGDGYFLEVIAAGDAFITDHATDRSTSSCAIATAAYTTHSDALKTIVLIGDRCIIASS
jgi:hypothetical protein